MSNVTVRKLGGEVLELSMLTFFRQLAIEDSYPKVLGRLMKEGQVQVELKDGSALVTYTSTSLTVVAPQPRLPLGEFTADAMLAFQLPARVHCRADSAPEAKHLVEEVITGAQGLPADFAIELDPHELVVFTERLEIKDLTVIMDVDVRSVEPRLPLLRGSSP